MTAPANYRRRPPEAPRPGTWAPRPEPTVTLAGAQRGPHGDGDLEAMSGHPQRTRRKEDH